MKTTQEIKSQIRKMAEAEYPILESTSTPLLSRMQMDVLRNQKAYERGGEAVMERLDIDEKELVKIVIQWDGGAKNAKNDAWLKQAILEAIRIR